MRNHWLKQKEDKEFQKLNNNLNLNMTCQQIKAFDKAIANYLDSNKNDQIYIAEIDRQLEILANVICEKYYESRKEKDPKKAKEFFKTLKKCFWEKIDKFVSISAKDLYLFKDTSVWAWNLWSNCIFCFNIKNFLDGFKCKTPFPSL